MDGLDTHALEAAVAQRLVTRGRRVAGAVLRAGAVLAGVLLLVALAKQRRYAEMAEHLGVGPTFDLQTYFAAMNVLFFAALAWLYRVRTQMLAKRGTFMVGRLIGDRGLFGNELLPTDHGPTNLLVVGQAMAMAARAVSNRLPSEMAGVEITVGKRNHWCDVYLFGDEEVIATEDGRVLCLVDTGRWWFYPPSPYVVRVDAGERDRTTFESWVQSMIEELSAGREHAAQPEVPVEHRLLSAQSLAVGAIGLVIVVAYAPVVAVFGWPMLALLSFIVGAPIAFSLAVHEPRVVDESELE